MRDLIGGGKAIELDNPIDLIVHTKAPNKWLLIDMETGQHYIGSNEETQYGHWVRVKDRDTTSQMDLVKPKYGAEYTTDELW